MLWYCWCLLLSLSLLSFGVVVVVVVFIVIAFNSSCTEMIMSKYIKILLGKTITSIVADKSLFLEVDPSYVAFSSSSSSLLLVLLSLFVVFVTMR